MTCPECGQYFEGISCPVCGWAYDEWSVKMIIETKPFIDEHGIRQWKSDHCPHACIQGNKESHTPEICPWYINKGARGIELCNRDEACNE